MLDKNENTLDEKLLHDNIVYIFARLFWANRHHRRTDDSHLYRLYEEY